MGWEQELKVLAVSDVKKNNSTLKKKLSMMKRLKNIVSENIEMLRSELISEDMSKFTSEIISSIFASKVQTEEDIRNIVRVTSALTSSNEFLDALVSEMMRILKDGIEDPGRYWIAAYFFDVQTMLQEMRNTERRENAVDELCSRMNEESRLLFLAYLSRNYMDEDVRTDIDRQLKSIGSLSVDNGNYRLIKAMNVLGMDVRLEDSEFKRKMCVEETEFQCCTKKTISMEDHEGGLSVKQIKEYMSRYSGDFERLDALSKSMRRFGSQKNIVSTLMQLKSNANHVASVARILKSMGAIAKKVISLMYKEIYETKTGKQNNTIANCLLLCQMCKFKEIPPNEIFMLLDHLFRNRNIEAYCVCLGEVGRCFLLDETTNCKTREYIEKIKRHRASELESMYINTCLSKLFSLSQTMSSVDPRRFLRCFFRKEMFSKTSSVWLCLLRNKATLLLMFLHPWNFEDVEFLAFLVREADLTGEVTSVIISGIHIAHNHSKHKCISLMKLYASITVSENREMQANLTNKVCLLDVDNVLKCRLMMIHIQRMPMDIKMQYIRMIKDLVDEEKCLELRILLFNLCEETGIELSEEECNDSFDEELDFMKYI